VEELLLLVDVEGGRFLIVKRAQPLPIGASPLERHVFADDLHDVRAVADFGDFVLRDQSQ
jgi:hypothetical protein